MSLQLLIVGGGIGGLAAALALGRGGHRVDVLEQAARFEEFGAGIQLGPNVVRRLRALGVEPALQDVAARPTRLSVRSVQGGDELARMVFDAARVRRYGAPYLCVHRADLHAVLLGALKAQGPSRLSLHTGARVSRIATRGGEAVCAAADDTRAWEADGLVGADGLWGATRARVIEHDAPPHRTGHTAWRALLAQAALPQALRSDRIQIWLGARVHVVAYPVRAGDFLNVVVLAEAAPPEGAGLDARGWDQEASLDTLRQATRQAGAGLRALLDAVPAWRAWTLHDRPPLQGPAQMAQARIALLGDAAHPMLPYLAQGAGMAIEDAATLAEVLAGVDAGQLPAAFAQYAAQRWARNARVQARARRNARIFHATGLLRWGRDWAMRLGGARVLDVPWLYAG
ncbi:FAD-dependent monooxygenase [Xenophilus sp. Marseille-Q4582]|uniref:FAD-dependent monooxygenase n=1 Tax=Xenophilus sp. Marseille-Q4582 TaxID=2866600 RepID=UPI001CE471F8|nr:FAD-dependent monooxygenase [Xenophilus sp. Marseille-Q4582]